MPSNQKQEESADFSKFFQKEAQLTTPNNPNPTPKKGSNPKLRKIILYLLLILILGIIEAYLLLARKANINSNADVPVGFEYAFPDNQPARLAPIK